VSYSVFFIKIFIYFFTLKGLTISPFWFKMVAYFCEGYARPTTLPYLTSCGSLDRVYTHLTDCWWMAGGSNPHPRLASRRNHWPPKCFTCHISSEAHRSTPWPSQPHVHLDSCKLHRSTFWSCAEAFSSCAIPSNVHQWRKGKWEWEGLCPWRLGLWSCVSS